MGSTLQLLPLLAGWLTICSAYCPSGWNESHTHCYLVTNSSVPFEAIPDECKNAHPNATAVSIHNIQDDVFIAGFLSKNGRGWMGLRRMWNRQGGGEGRKVIEKEDSWPRTPRQDKHSQSANGSVSDAGGDDDEQVFEWVDGTDVDLTYWDQISHQPSSDRTKNCGYISAGPSFAAWGLENCNNSYPAICQVPKTTCPEKWTHHQDKCLSAGQDKVPGSAAQPYCKNNLPGSQPASSHSFIDDETLWKLAGFPGYGVWLGLHRSLGDTPGPWQWYDHSPVNYTAWWRHPEDDEGCSCMRSGQIFWEPEKCDERILPVVCQAPAHYG